MADGMRTMDENGEFHLEEPYRTQLEEAKTAIFEEFILETLSGDL